MTLNELKLNNTDNQNLYCNIITPPSDAPEDQFPSVLIFDAEWDAIEDIVLWCRAPAICDARDRPAQFIESAGSSRSVGW